VKKCQPRALTPFLDGELSDELRQEISDHLQSCPSCGALLDELSVASQQVRSMGRAEIPRSALQPALDVVTDRVGLIRRSTNTRLEAINAARPPAGVTVADPQTSAPTPKPAAPPEVPSTLMYEWSDPDKLHAAETPAVSGEEEVGMSLGDQDRPVSPDLHSALPEHPNPPPAEINPPWMQAVRDEDEDLEEVGRRAIDESIGAAEAEPAEDVVEEPQRGRSGREIARTEAEPVAAEPPPGAAPPRTAPQGYWSRPAPKPARSGRGLGSLRTQIRIGLLSALVLIVLAAAVLYTTRNARQVSTGTTPSTPTQQATRSPAPSSAATTTPSAAASVPSAPAPVGQLTGVVTAGAGGSGWHVVRVRSGNPSAGVTRIVFDLEGAGPAPDARLGRGPDGAVYLTAPGISISPSEMSGFVSAGPVTAMTQTGPSGLGLRLATSGNPGFSVGYLSAPNRLVLDFK
jgi:Putative zinc-finger